MGRGKMRMKHEGEIQVFREAFLSSVDFEAFVISSLYLSGLSA
jgi:hypothetical protein